MKKVLLWFWHKVVEPLLPTILPTVGLWVLSALGTVRVWAHQKSVPLWLFLIVLVPASLGIVGLVRSYFRHPNFHVTSDPLNSFCSEAMWGGAPAAQVRLFATFANGTKYDVVLLYAHLKGTKPLMHFDTPLHIPPYKAIQKDVLFFCTAPKRKISSTYEADVIFVDAGKTKFSQRMTIRGIPSPGAVPSTAKLNPVKKS
jgi:hypothetical protein